MHILSVLFSQVVQKQMLGEVENWTAIWCHEYVYKKLLKLDDPSLSYGQKCAVFFIPHCVDTSTMKMK